MRPGDAGGRPTTTIELAVKAERLKGWGEGRLATALARSLVEMDDATGAALAIKDFNAAGELLRSVTANEVKANAGLDKKPFAYTPPEGAKVTDLNAPPPEPAKSPGNTPKGPGAEKRVGLTETTNRPARPPGWTFGRLGGWRGAKAVRSGGQASGLPEKLHPIDKSTHAAQGSWAC